MNLLSSMMVGQGCDANVFDLVYYIVVSTGNISPVRAQLRSIEHIRAVKQAYSRRRVKTT